MPVRHEFADDAAFEDALRDYFAGQALAGILATGAGEDDSQTLRQIIADDAYCYADAMLSARKEN